MLELPMPEAIGTSLLVIVINSAVALSTRLATTTIDWSTAAPFALAAILGVLTGGRIADRLDPKRSQQWFAALLVAVAIYNRHPRHHEPRLTDNGGRPAALIEVFAERVIFVGYALASWAFHSHEEWCHRV